MAFRNLNRQNPSLDKQLMITVAWSHQSMENPHTTLGLRHWPLETGNAIGKPGKRGLPLRDINFDIENPAYMPSPLAAPPLPFPWYNNALSMVSSGNFELEVNCKRHSKGRVCPFLPVYSSDNRKHNRSVIETLGDPGLQKKNPTLLFIFSPRRR